MCAFRVLFYFMGYGAGGGNSGGVSGGFGPHVQLPVFPTFPGGRKRLASEAVVDVGQSAAAAVAQARAALGKGKGDGKDGKSKKGGGKAAAKAAKDEKQAKNVLLKNDITALGNNSQAIAAKIDAEFAGGADRLAVVRSLLGQCCRNCMVSGRGYQKHFASACRELGNPPTIPCVKCASKGHGAVFHRPQDCTSA